MGGGLGGAGGIGHFARVLSMVHMVRSASEEVAGMIRMAGAEGELAAASAAENATAIVQAQLHVQQVQNEMAGHIPLIGAALREAFDTTEQLTATLKDLQEIDKETAKITADAKRMEEALTLAEARRTGGEAGEAAAKAAIESKKMAENLQAAEISAAKASEDLRNAEATLKMLNDRQKQLAANYVGPDPWGLTIGKTAEAVMVDANEKVQQQMDSVAGLKTKWEDAQKAVEKYRVDAARTTGEELTKAAGEALKTDPHRLAIEGMQKQAEEIDQLVQRLEEEAATYGKTAAEIEDYRLAHAGASEEIRKHAASVEAQIEAVRAAAKEQSDAARIVEDVKTPQERLADRLRVLDKMVKDGTLTWDQYGRAVKKAFEDQGKAAGESRVGYAGAESLTSGGGVSMLLGVGTSRESKVEENTAAANAYLSSMDQSLKTVAQATTNQPGVWRMGSA